MGSAVDKYLKPLPTEHRKALEKLRQTIRSAVPGVEETIGTGVNAFGYKGRPLVSIGAAKRHVSLFIMYGAVLETFKEELRAFDTSNTVIRFPPDRPLPQRLVRKLVRARMAEIEAVSQRR
jgi:uncharacterized protein YdhG (YjbR/CyaY superfamily)